MLHPQLWNVLVSPKAANLERTRAQSCDVWAPAKNRYFARNVRGQPSWTPPGSTCARAIWWCLGTSQKLLLCRTFEASTPLDPPRQYMCACNLVMSGHLPKTATLQGIWRVNPPGPPPGNTCARAIWWCLGTSQKPVLCKEFEGSTPLDPPPAICVRAQFGDVWAPPKNCYFARNLKGQPTWTPPPRATRARAQFGDVWAPSKNRYFARNLRGQHLDPPLATRVRAQFGDVWALPKNRFFGVNPLDALWL